MPRDSSGNYTLPSGNPVIDGTIIESTWANNTLDDVATQLNNVLTRDGLLGPQFPVLFVNGTVALPGIAFAQQPSSGLYRLPPSTVGLSVAGVSRQIWNETGTTLTGAVNITGTVGPITVESLGVTGSLTVSGASNLASLLVTGASQLGGAGAGTTVSTSGRIVTPASTTTEAGFNLPHGTAPTTPANGDLWTTTTATFVRINGTTRQLMQTSGTQSISGATTFSSTVAMNGGVTIGDAAGDAFTINSTTWTIPAAGVQFAGGGANSILGLGRAPTGTLDVFSTPASTGLTQILVANGQSGVTGSISAVSSAYSGFPLVANSLSISVGSGNTPIWIGQGQAGTGYVGFVTNGTEKMRITPEGNVGIGTSTPQNWGAGYVSLSLNAATGSNLDMFVNGTRMASMAASASAAVVGSNAAIPLAFITNGTEKARITSAGDFGVGLTPPNYGAGTATIAVGSTSNSLVDLTTGGVRMASFSAQATQTIIGTIANFPLAFWTNATEKMQIAANGNVAIGTAPTAHKLTVRWTTAGNGIAAESVTSDPSSSFLSQRADNVGSTMTMRINVTVAGSISHPTLTTTAYNTSSDRRLKRNIRPVPDVGRIIDNIPVVSFDWKTDGAHCAAGIIAQDLHGLFPGAVHVGSETDEHNDPWQTDLAKLVPILVREIQCLRERVSSLEH